MHAASSSLAAAAQQSDSNGDDSDFDSSQLEEVLMPTGNTKDRIWGQRARKKRKQKRAARKSRASDDVAAMPVTPPESDEEPLRKRRGVEHGRERIATGRSSLPALLSDASKSLFVQAQIQYGDRKFDEAVETCKELIRLEPGLPEPYHVLTLISKERSEMATDPKEINKYRKKQVDFLHVAARLTPGADGRSLFKRVGDESKELGLIDQAVYAYKRSIGGRNDKTIEELDSMRALAQLYFQKGRRNEGIIQLYAIYQQTGKDEWARSVAEELVASKRWRECLELLGGCVERGKASGKGVNPDTLNMYCEVLLEVRDFEKCASLLIEVLCLSSAGDTGLRTSLTAEQLNERLRLLPVDLVTKLAVACCHLRKSSSTEPDTICSCAIECVLWHPAEDWSDLYLPIVDALLANETSLATGASPRHGLIRNTCIWPAKLALRILDLLEISELEPDEDVKERRAKALWHLGNAKEAARLLEEVYEHASSRSDKEQRELGIRIAEAWYECGEPERAEIYVMSLTWEDLQDTKILPRAMSSEQRRAEYKELHEQADRLMLKLDSTKELEWEELQPFHNRFRYLVLDCELDKTRLTRRNRGSAAIVENEDGNAEQFGGADREATAGEDSLACGIVAVRSVDKQCTDLQLLDNAAVAHKFKRKHLGLESIEDLFGFEAYISFLLKGLTLLHACKFKDDKGASLRIRTVEISRIVDICDMVCINRRLVDARNPIKRRLLRALSTKTVVLAFEARHWHYVFKHLRWMCRKSVDEGPLALLSRMLFTHPELHLPPTRSAKKSVDPAPWDKPHQAVSSSGHRTTYAASMVDVRQWALRQLIQKPTSYALQLLAGHFCINASQYPLAVAEYCRAHRLAPFDAMTCLCLAAAYISFSMSRIVVKRHDLVCKGFAFLQRYRKLRLEALSRKGEADTISIDDLVLGAEAEYNYGRGFHQLAIYTLAVTAYRNALEICENVSEDQLKTNPRPDFVAVRRASAYNLATLYRAQGSLDIARETLRRHIRF